MKTANLSKHEKELLSNYFGNLMKSDWVDPPCMEARYFLHNFGLVKVSVNDYDQYSSVETMIVVNIKHIKLSNLFRLKNPIVAEKRTYIKAAFWREEGKGIYDVEICPNMNRFLDEAKRIFKLHGIEDQE